MNPDKDMDHLDQTQSDPTKPNSDRQPPYSWVLMGNLWGIDTCNVFVFFSIGVLIPVWTEDMGMTSLQAGLMGSTGFLGFGLMALPASIWLTKYNPRIITLICTLGMAFVALIHAIAPTVTILLFARIAFVILAVSRIQIQVIFIQRWFFPRLYAFVNSIDFSVRSLGQMVAAAATPILIVLMGSWRHVFASVSLLLVILSVTWVLSERGQHTHQVNNNLKPQHGNPAGVLKRHKILWVVAGCQLGAAITFASYMTFYPTYAMDHLGISLSTVGVLMAAFPAGGILGSLSSGPLSQTIGMRRPFVWIPGILLPGMYFSLLVINSTLISMLIMFAAGFLAMGVPVILATIPMDMRLAPREVAVSHGLMRTLFPVGATIGPIFVGMIDQHSGSLFTGLSIVAPCAISLLIGGIAIPETGARKLPTMEPR